MTRLRLYWTFARSFMAANAAISLICWWFILKHGVTTFAPLFYFKFATCALVYYVTNLALRRHYYYYANLGLGKARLWVPVLLFDLVGYLLIGILILVL